MINQAIVRLKALAVIGDCPALKIALNFIGHNGYNCCFFCYIRGTPHGEKRQYPYEHTCRMRSADQFCHDAATAARCGRNEQGHLGVSAFSRLLDIQLPSSVLIDYAHVTLLRHAKSIFLDLYQRLRPADRQDCDAALSEQAFLHFFHRRMKPFSEFSFVKATEVRNILFYGFLPICHRRFSVDIIGHFCLLVCGIRLLHGSPILGQRTSNIANKLLIQYYQDFGKFYSGLENFVLHLHHHYADQYERFESFSHLGSFGQESLIGYLSSNHKGTRYHGDLISQNYTFDFLLHHQLETIDPSSLIHDGPFDIDTNFDFTSYDVFISFHDFQDTGSPSDSNLVAFQRCRIRQHIYHSLQYKRCRKSASYIIRFRRTDDSDDYAFGNVIVFFTSGNCTYALVQKYSIHFLFNDLLSFSAYHQLLSEPINHFFYVLSKHSSSGYECIQISRIIDHCILFNCLDYFIITTVSSYDEHD